MTLAERMQIRGNNLDFLRFSAAVMVIVSHCCAFLPATPEYFAAFTGWETLGTLGVCIFFTISGFLISKSWEDDPRLLAFATKRFLRIWPGLLATTLFCVFIIGPLATWLPRRAYFQDPLTWDYFWGLLVFPLQFDLPGVFTHNHYPNAVNGALWTLPAEVLGYGLVALLGSFGVLRARNLPWLLLAAVYYFRWNYTIRPEAPNYFAGTLSLRLAQVWFSYFLIGMGYYQYRDRIVLSGTACSALLLFVFITLKTPHVELAMLLAVPYLVFYVAYQALPQLHSFSRYGDFSYGLYIYAFPIQQLVAQRFGKHLTWLTLFLAAFGPILGMAALSWHFIERPVLRLKPRRLVHRPESQATPRLAA